MFQKHQNYKTKTAVYKTKTKTTLQDQDQKPIFWSELDRSSPKTVGLSKGVARGNFKTRQTLPSPALLSPPLPLLPSTLLLSLPSPPLEVGALEVGPLESS